MRTVLCLNLNHKIIESDLRECFKDAGRVRNVKLIRDQHTNKSKGLAYVEFYEFESVAKATGFTGKKLLGNRIIVETSQAEKNREYAATAAANKAAANVGSAKLKIKNVPSLCTAEDIKQIFHPFGAIISATVQPDTTSLSYTPLQIAYVQFTNANNAEKCMKAMDGFSFNGNDEHRFIITQMTEASIGGQQKSILDNDAVERGGVNLGKTGRFELMAKLAEGSGLVLPELANKTTAIQTENRINMPTQCLVISNFFDGKKGLTNDEVTKIQDEIIEQTNKHGSVYHIDVDKYSPDGNVYVKFQNIGVSTAMFTTFNNKSYANRPLRVAYLTVKVYHELYPDSANAFKALNTSETLKSRMLLG